MYLDYEEWVKHEGKKFEGAVQKSTIQQVCQQKRIEWLVDNTIGGCVIELGCNWGYILNEICKGNNGIIGVGIDINLENICLARLEFNKPKEEAIFPLSFLQGDITKKQPFPNSTFDTVLIPDVLEHLPFEEVINVLYEAVRLCKKLILITLPWEETKRDCFKHRWKVDPQSIDEITQKLINTFHLNVHKHTDGHFYYIRGIK